MNSKENKSLGSWKRLLASCGGSTLHTLEKCDPDDIQRRVSSGGVVMVIAAVSAIVAGIAWAMPVGPVGYFVSIPWFFIMLLLERSILQQMDSMSAHKMADSWMKGDFSSSEEKSTGIGWLLLRFLMIFFICYFNSEMIRVIMFKPEIVAEIKLRQDSETKEIADSLSFVKEQIIASLEVNESAVAVSKKDLSSLVSGYNQKISAVNDSISALNLRLPHEIKGPGGISGIAGDGPVAQGIRESITSLEKQRDQIIRERNDAVLLSPEAANEQFALAELEKARLRSEKEIARIDTLEREMVQKVLARPVNGLSFMLEVLNDIAGRNFIIWAVFFMFFFIEGIPVLLKFFSKVDSFIYLRALDILKKRKDSAEIASASADSIREIQQAHIS